MKGPAIRFGILGILFATLAGCNYSAVEVRESYIPMEPARPHKMSYRRSGEACTSRLFGFVPLGGSTRIDAAIAKMTQGSDRIDNILGLHVENKWAFWVLGTTNCTVVSGYPIIYVDDNQKRGVFSRRMMYGPGGGAAAAPSTPVRATPPVVAATPRPKPTPAPPPAAAPTAAPAPKPAARPAAPTKAECESRCARFAGIWKGSAAIQGTIRRSCVQKCLKPAKKAYRDCVDSASSIEDIGKCNNL